jgi:predicted flap endonuclease-1-like 5' DNA nuclease
MSTTEPVINLNADTKLVLEFIQNTNQPIFLTGKAGTGKTTLLRHIKNNCGKNLAIVAPTAVAALNAGGVTMHSFFQIPFGPLVPSEGLYEAGEEATTLNFAPEKIRLFNCLELLIIDEISMVRADVLDYVDFVLRSVNSSSRPFGGVQVLMIGDLYQLPPVANRDWPLLSKYYTSAYFFASRVFKAATMVTFELTQVYRQADPVFIEILNGIRNDNLDDTQLNRLNQCYQADLQVTGKEEYITLTTHNQLVGEINSQRLENLQGELHRFKATISGDFPKDAYPADEELLLKAGAQVMFTKNDSSGKKQFYNGRTAKIKSITGDAITLEFIDDGSDFQLLPEIWQNVKYGLNESDQKITETNSGSFSQYPVKLAWAITIHKSQGLTFDKAIVDVSSAFAHGQAYVALSRCRSLEGMILNAPVKQQNIITDPQVIRFMQQAVGQKPDDVLLQQSVYQYKLSLVEELMNFNGIKLRWQQLGGLLNRFDAPDGPLNSQFVQWDDAVQKEIAAVAQRFVKQEVAPLQTGQNEQAQQALAERLKKAAGYFIPKVDDLINALHRMIVTPWANHIPEDKVINVLNHCLSQLVTKLALLKAVQANFTPETFLAAKHAASTGYRAATKAKTAADKPLTYPHLYQELLTWRKSYAAEKNLTDHGVMAEKTLKLIAEKTPRSMDDLSAIKGIGPVKAKLIGPQVIKVISSYFGAQQLF